MYKGLIFQVYEADSQPIDKMWANKFHRRMAGGHRIASFLRENNWDIEVIDFAAMFSLDELKEIAKSRITDDTYFIAFSSIFSCWNPKIDEFAGWIKKNYNVVTILGGGTWPSINSKYIDYYIIGYGENAILQLLKVVAGGQSRSSLRFDLRFADRLVINSNSSYPSFPTNSLVINYEKRDFLLPEEWTNIELSRGCIFKCKFCNLPLLGVKGQEYIQSADEFDATMRKNYDLFGLQNYYVVDDTFNDYTKKISRFADVVENLPFTPFYSGFIRADLLIARPNDKEELSRMNFLGHYYGIESFNYESSKVMGKGMDSEKLKQGLIDIKNYFLNNNRKIYRGSISFIAGLPHDTLKNLYETAEWCKNYWQGQNVQWNHLMIPNKDQSGHGWQDSLSDLAHNYEKYGYEKITNEDKTSELWWKNSNMSIIEAKQFTQSTVLKLCPEVITQETSWTLDDLTYKGRSIDIGLNEQEHIKHKIKSKMHKKSIVENYKQKKLSI